MKTLGGEAISHSIPPQHPWYVSVFGDGALPWFAGPVAAPLLWETGGDKPGESGSCELVVGCGSIQICM